MSEFANEGLPSIREPSLKVTLPMFLGGHLGFESTGTRDLSLTQQLATGGTLLLSPNTVHAAPCLNASPNHSWRVSAEVTP
jgi:hypothetical protein